MQSILIFQDISEEAYLWGVDFQLTAPLKIISTKKNSTETEIMSVDDVIPEIFWNWYFIVAKGYNVKDSCLHQENKCSIIVENNGKYSRSKCIKHINIRYFFITDRVKKCEVSVFWCPIGDMVGEYMTKPLQGDMFRKFRDQIMGLIPAADSGPGKVKVERISKV